MDPLRFDALTRSFGARLSRRTALGTLPALLGLGVVEDAAAKCNKKKPCGSCRRCKKGKCKKAKDGTRCAGGTCTGGRCRGGGGSGTCTIDPAGNGGSTVTLTKQTTVTGHLLRASQSVSPFSPDNGTASRLDVTLDGAPFLTITTTGQGRTVRASFEYGVAFGGIRRAQLSDDGTTLSGEINGRAIVPLPASADPASVRFADGNPPPTVTLEPDLAGALTRLLKAVSESVDDCAGREQVSARARPEASAACLALYIPCQTASTGCVAGVAGGCTAALFGYPVCVLAGLAACTYAGLQCRKSVRYSQTCCPVRCGGSDVLNVFGEDPSCCERDETCIDPRANDRGCCAPGFTACAGVNCCAADETCQSNGQCCPSGSRLCGEVCCPNGSCQNGQCCDFPNVTCGTSCCPPFSSCCGGRCCRGICTSGVCCVAPETYCNGRCCANNCCNGVCCAGGETCGGPNGSCARTCATGEYACPVFPGNPPCCKIGRSVGGQQRCCPGVAATATAKAGCCDFGLKCCSVGNGRNACRDNCLA